MTQSKIAMFRFGEDTRDAAHKLLTGTFVQASKWIRCSPVPATEGVVLDAEERPVE